MLTHYPLIKSIAKEGKHTFISTGMHDLDEINKVVNIFRNRLVVERKMIFPKLQLTARRPLKVE